MCSAFDSLREDAGQATVEAAFALPVVFLLLLLLLQPSIILFDRMVMSSAAAEGCRHLVTATGKSGDPDKLCEDLVRRRLSAVPQQDCFHVHGGSCSWEIETTGGEGSGSVSVRIVNKVRPLPLLDEGMTLLGLLDGDGYLPIEVEASMPTQPSWVSGSSSGLNPSGWTGAWL